jgi:hypothetical protein
MEFWRIAAGERVALDRVMKAGGKVYPSLIAFARLTEPNPPWQRQSTQTSRPLLGHDVAMPMQNSAEFCPEQVLRNTHGWSQVVRECREDKCNHEENEDGSFHKSRGVA